MRKCPASPNRLILELLGLKSPAPTGAARHEPAQNFSMPGSTFHFRLTGATLPTGSVLL